MKSFTALTLALLAVAVSGAAFVPAPTAAKNKHKTALAFGFLKELGLEKPDWLPDFGGEKKEEAAPEPVAEDSGEGEEAAEEAEDE